MVDEKDNKSLNIDIVTVRNMRIGVRNILNILIMLPPFRFQYIRNQKSLQGCHFIFENFARILSSIHQSSDWIF